MDNRAGIDPAAISVNTSAVNCNFEDCRFIKNSAENPAGAVCIGVDQKPYGINSSFEDCKFMSNTADTIGTVIAFGGERFGSVELTTNEAEKGEVITANTPTSNCYFDECTFINNMADIASGSKIGY